MDSLISRASELHSASGVARQILELMQTKDFSIEEVSKCIEKDPALATRVLSTVNSSASGTSRRIASIHQAVVMLGHQHLRTIVLTFTVIERLTKGVEARVYTEFWKRSLTTGLVASALAKLKDVDTDDGYTAGLLADIGILLLAQFEPDRYLKIFDGHPHGPQLIAAEQAEFGFDHADLGARMLEIWGFPQEIVIAVNSHHDSDEAEMFDLASLVRAGNLMPGAIWIADTESFHAAFDYFESCFDFSIDSFINLAIDANELVDEEAVAYGVEGIELVDCESLQETARELLKLSPAE